MNSFDVFDTLIARRNVTSRPFFHQIQQEFNVENFVDRRIKADTGTRSFADIYQALGLGRLTREMMARELELEHQNVVPIQENIDRVQHGDLLISDMYFPSCDILSLVRCAGLDKQVCLYQSNGGKASGAIWQRLGDRKPALHLGDNPQSDVDMPSRFGIRCELFNKSQFTPSETTFHANGFPSLALLMREVRLRGNPKHYRLLHNISSQINLPWLFVISELLRRRDQRPKVFLGRDSQQLYILYNAFFEPSYYVPFSRKVAYAQSQDAIRYLLTNAPKDALFVDIFSTGGTWEKLQAPIDITVALYLDFFFYTKDRPVLPPGFSYLIKSTDCDKFHNMLIELMNCGDHGYLSQLDVYDGSLFAAKFAEPSISTEVIQNIQAPTKAAARLSQFYRWPILQELKRINDDKLLELLVNLTIELSVQRGLEQFIPNWQDHEDHYLASLSQSLGSAGVTRCTAS